ncbi:MAG: MFS transporter [Bacillaceae bacterium]|nr:MFS transporter [Bacillaceae bacterium]
MSQVQAGLASEDQKQKKFEVFNNKSFLFLFISSLMSAPGYYVYLIGVEWLMLTISEERFYFGLLFIAASIPRLIFMGVGGVVADRFQKKTILFLTDITRASFVLIILFLLLWSDIQIWHLVILSALFGISDAFSFPTTDSLTAEILNEEELQRGNSLIQMTKQISPIFGPILGGSLIVWIGFSGVFTMAFAMMTIASITVLFVRPKTDDRDMIKDSPFQDFKKGIEYVRSKPLLKTIMLIGFVVNFFVSGPLTLGIPIIVKDVFNQNALGLSTLQVSLGIGALTGAFLLSLISNMKKPGRMLLVFMIAFGIVYMLTGLALHLYVNAALLLIGGILLQFINIPIITMVQRTTDKKMLGRVMGLLMTISTGLVPVSFLVTSVLLALDVHILTIVIAGGAFAAAFPLLLFKNQSLVEFKYDHAAEKEGY